jgi:MFS family permease
MKSESFDDEDVANVVTSEGPIVTGPDPEKPPASITVSKSADAPDGGVRAWLQVMGSFLVFGNLWGITFAFGSFQSYYELTYLTSNSASTISWIGTISTFLLILGGIASGPLFDHGYFRSMLIVGACVETLGLFLLSLCGSYYQILLTQGVLMGLGNGLLYIPGLALVGIPLPPTLTCPEC